MDYERIKINNIYVDTSSLMHDHVQTLFFLQGSIGTSRIKYLIPKIVIDELIRCSRKINNNTSVQAEKGLVAAQSLFKNNHCVLLDSRQCKTADQYFLEEIVSKRITQNLALLTQDKQLAKDVYLLSQSIMSMRTNKRVDLFRLSYRGQLEKWVFSHTANRCKCCNKYFDSKSSIKGVMQQYCPECMSRIKNTGHTLTCVECNRSFMFTVLEQHNYAAKGYCVPKRCKKCRDSRRRMRQEIFATDSVYI